ncbi:hypothetical protein P4S72_20140 [Vibrio sp. PP-XX7]
MTMTQWRDDQRISRAKQLLVTTNYSINHIGRIIGYSDPLISPGCLNVKRE